MPQSILNTLRQGHAEPIADKHYALAADELECLARRCNHLEQSLRNIVTLFENDIKRGAPEQLRQARELLSE